MPLRLIPDQRAGPGALGLLVPPGPRTVLVLRPRALPYDLLLIDGIAGTVFREMAPAEAAATARALLLALQDWEQGGRGHVQSVAVDGGYAIWADVGDFALVACDRRPGQPYRPFRAETEAEAQQIATQVGAILHPGSHVDQEVYFNTRHFLQG